MEWLIAALVALLDEISPKRTGSFTELLDEQATGLAAVTAENRRRFAEAVDSTLKTLRDEDELVASLIGEIKLLNSELVEISARNVVLAAGQRRLEAQHEADRAHIRELIAEMVRRDIR